MTVTREDLNPCTVRLSISVDAPEVKKGFDRAYKKLSKNLKLPGFRAGAAPRTMIEPMLDPNERANAAAEEIVRATMNTAIQEQGLQPDLSTQPTVDFKALDENEGTAEYDLKVALPPQVELASYTGVQVPAPDTDVTDEDVDFQIEEFRKRKSTREAVTDRGVQEGDVALVTIKPDGAETGSTFMIVAGQSFEGMDAALQGMRAEDVKALDLSFPEDFQDKSLAGTTAHVSLTVNTVSAVRLPDVDDAFAQSLQAEDSADLRGKVREALVRAKSGLSDEIASDAIINDIVGRSTIHVSDNMWETLADRRLTEIAQEQGRLGKSLEQYAQEQGMTIDAFVEDWRERARHEVERALVIQQIFVKEEMRVTNEDLNVELFRLANENGTNPEEMLRILHANQAVQELQFRSIQRKVREYLLKNASFGTAEAPATETAEEPAPAAEAAPTEE
jgi:trigger factor